MKLTNNKSIFKITVMNRNEARKLAETVTDEEIAQMFLNAQKSIKNWEGVSRVNKGLTKGTAFNILSKGGVCNHILGRTNQIWEFGEYLPNYQKPVKEKKQQRKPTHQEPKFIEEDFPTEQDLKDIAAADVMMKRDLGSYDIEEMISG